MDFQHQHKGKQLLLGETGPRSGTNGTKRTHSNRNLLHACLCSYLSALSFGFTIGYSSPALPQMTAKGGPLDDKTASWFGSIVTIGGMVGCPIAGALVDRIGRKNTLLSTALPFALGWIFIFGFSDILFLCCGRLLTGVGSGMVTVVAPLFVAEVSTKELRGMLGSGVQLSITVGILMVYTLGMLVGWRMLALFGLLIPILAIVISLRVPDTPIYYLIKNKGTQPGNNVEALRALLWLRAGRGQDEAEEELADMVEGISSENGVAWGELLTSPELYQPLKVSMGLMFFQQLCGINAVMFYTVSIFQSAGFGESGQLATVAVGAVQVVVTVGACWMMDRAGRRLLLLASGVGMLLTCASMGFYYYHISRPAPTGGVATDLSWLALASLIVYIICFAIGWGPIPMLVMSEIFPSRARGTASAIASVTNWLFAFIVTKEFVTLQALLGQHGAFYFFSLCCALGLGFVLRWVPETKGKSLEDIELYFLGRSLRGI